MCTASNSVELSRLWPCSQSATASGAQLPDPQSPQAPVSSKAIVIRGRAPVNEQLLRVKLPKPQQAVLANGLHLIVLEDRRVPRITIDLRIPGAGGYDDPVDLPGLGNRYGGHDARRDDISFVVADFRAA